MNQANVTKLVPKLRINVPDKHRRLRNLLGPEGRINKLRKTVTGLIKFERIEVNFERGDEARQYAERLIGEAIAHGDCHKPTMEMADYWLLEKELVHKLFKVLVPRFENSPVAYTRMIKAPRAMNARHPDKAVLELRGNPFPTLTTKQPENKLLLHNILLDAAKQEYRQAKYAEIAKNIGENEVPTEKEDSDKN